jgi:hypothetical protein
MSNKPLPNANRNNARPAVPCGKSVSVAKNRRTRNRQRVLMVGIAIVSTSLVSVLLALAVDFPMSVLSQPSLRFSNAKSDNAVPQGNIVTGANGSTRCRTFDNGTGQVADSGCQQRVDFDANGMPIPRGTIKRLDTISKSFARP